MIQKKIPFLKLGLRSLTALTTAATFSFLAGCTPVKDNLVSKAMYKGMFDGFSEPRLNTLPDGLHAFLCGAGSPLPDPKRSGPCTAIVAGNQLFIIDAGSGSPRNLGPNGFPPGQINAVLLTHNHSDHIDSLGELNLLSWAQGQRKAPLKVYGPKGVERVVEGFNMAYKEDGGYRIEHHGEETIPPSGYGMKATPLPILKSGDSKLILRKDGLTITAFAVEHEPVHQALGYRFDYKGRSIVISGDTKKSSNLLKQATGADVLIHEALDPELLAIMEQAAKDAGASNMAKITHDITDYHTTPEEAASIAEQAGVDVLIFNHIVPALPLSVMNSKFLEGVDEHFQGKVVLGKDGTFISLPTNDSTYDIED